MLLSQSGGKPNDVRVAVGGRAEHADTDLGAISAPEAARYLLKIAPALSGRSADNAVISAAIADSANLWQRMLEIARDNDASEASRKSSLFWVSQKVGTVATAGLSAVAMDDDATNGECRSNCLVLPIAQQKGWRGSCPRSFRVVQGVESAKMREGCDLVLVAESGIRGLSSCSSNFWQGAGGETPTEVRMHHL